MVQSIFVVFWIVAYEREVEMPALEVVKHKPMNPDVGVCDGREHLNLLIGFLSGFRCVHHL